MQLSVSLVWPHLFAIITRTLIQAQAPSVWTWSTSSSVPRERAKPLLDYAKPGTFPTADLVAL